LARNCVNSSAIQKHVSESLLLIYSVNPFPSPSPFPSLFLFLSHTRTYTHTYLPTSLLFINQRFCDCSGMVQQYSVRACYGFGQSNVSPSLCTSLPSLLGSLLLLPSVFRSDSPPSFPTALNQNSCSGVGQGLRRRVCMRSRGGQTEPRWRDIDGSS
jgi:hypothetical protein